MATLQDKLIRMQNSQEFKYRFINNYHIIAKKQEDGWHVQYYDNDWNLIGLTDSVYTTAEEIVNLIFAKEMTHINEVIEYLDEFIYEGVSVSVDPIFVRSTVLDKIEITEGE